ncbi:hypothetical protein ACLQ2N_32855 [Streptomyces sp. DT224]|uniref:hypothetical protein n=1 Tax=Streptomyces sp. DT224 TaxID=3393426 RepID=UPI003CEDB9CB
MSVSPCRRRFGALAVGVALIVVGAILAAFAVFGGDPQAPDPKPSQTACNVFDPECGGSPTPTGPTEPSSTPQLPSPTVAPPDGSGGTSEGGTGGGGTDGGGTSEGGTGGGNAGGFFGGTAS